ncbi:MAG: ATP-binding cassette domain-containing protein [Acidimicrobiaceae bacterium]|nr:ATP-binding cassette domain-containing protein [Acidimicrobiaceae bacterium]
MPGAAQLSIQAECTGSAEMALLRVQGLRKRFPVTSGVLRRRTGHIHAVDGVDFEIEVGESLGLVGESGCGKSTTGRMLACLDEPDEGRILLTEDDGSEVDIAQLDTRGMTRFRRRVQMIFQDPYESINPRRTVFETISESLGIHRMGGLRYREERVSQMLARVGLTPPESFMLRYPHELSGGQRQRVAVARALILQPQFVVADEPTSMLDMSIRASIMELMSGLARELGVAYLYITHDLAVARYMCDRIAVMYLGKIVETGRTEQILSDPAHPYTQALLSAVPIPDPSLPPPELRITGGVDKAIDPPPRCRFLDRCPQAVDICSTADHPPLQDTGGGRLVACYLTTDREG